MKLLVDACAGRRLARDLQTDHEVVFAGDWERDPGDDEILALARAEHRVIITRDKDFGTISVRDRQAHWGIVRLVELSPTQELISCRDALARFALDLERGALITVEAHRIRIREPDSG